MDGSLLSPGRAIVAPDIRALIAEAHQIVRGIARRVHGRTGYSPRADEIQALIADAGGDLCMLAASGGDATDVLRRYRNATIRRLTPRGKSRGPADAMDHLDDRAVLDGGGAVTADDAEERGRRGPRHRPLEPLELGDGADPLALLLLAEDEVDAGEAVQVAATQIALKPPRPRGRPRHGELLERAGQRKLPGLPPGGSTTRARDAEPPPPAHAHGPPPPEQPTLF